MPDVSVSDDTAVRRVAGRPPLLGLLSDTHDRVDIARAAIDLLLDAGATRLIHLGDLCGERVIELLAGHDAHFVWGNNETDRRRLEAYAATVGVTCHGDVGRMDVAGRMVGFTHGHLQSVLRSLVKTGDCDYVLHGHTHERRDERFGRTRVINPGALHRCHHKSVALLDLELDTLRTISVRPI